MIELIPISEFDTRQDRVQVQVLVSAVYDGCGGFETHGLGAKLRPTHFTKKKTLEIKLNDYFERLAGPHLNGRSNILLGEIRQSVIKIAKEHHEAKND
jgi:hypothetical protein